ncbi:hypothetical protein [Cryobacterium sp. Y50]|uniref:hypothetical protein n=1 Tax=Cryobacterium sp. Y50 TaxID=2048286 RepID=UPI000CE340CE|nr:hypothetical protein [Cryobacterium sp. Y50]
MNADLKAEAEVAAQPCTLCDAGLPANCVCATHQRDLITRLLVALETADAALDRIAHRFDGGAPYEHPSSFVESVSSTLLTTGRTLTTNTAEILTLSGLTVNQVGSLLGVTGRTVAGWAAGGALNPGKAVRVAQILGVVRELPGTTADERRTQLLDTSSQRSIFQWLRDQQHTEAKVRGS